MKKIFILLLVLCFPIFVFAETIVLKSGKTVEGKLIEKTDKYIKIDFMGVPITYFNDEIDTINEKKISLPASDTSPGFTEPNQRVSEMVSDDWIKTKEVSGYLNSEQALMNKFHETIGQMNNSLDEAMAKNDRAQLERISARLGAEFSASIQDLKALNPPAELKDYHKKSIEGMNYMKMGFDATINKDVRAFIKYHRMSMLSAIEATEMKKNVYIRHKAPQEVIADLDRGIEQLKADIETLPKGYISDIDETKNVPSNFTKSNQQGDLVAFSDWIQSKEISNYLNTVETYSAKEEEAMRQFKFSMEQAMNKDDQVEASRIFSQMSTTFSTIISNLKTINPPSEFKDYHKKVIESYNYLRMFFEGMENSDKNSLSYLTTSKTSMIGALEMLKKIYSNHKAPPDAYAMINSLLARLNSR